MELNAEKIKKLLKNNYKDSEILIYKLIDSTNIEAKKLCKSNLSKETIIIANEQTLGKGRLCRKFFSPKDTGIYMSIILKTNTSISNAILITTATSVAVCRAIKKVCNLDMEIKWVNDIFFNNKKVCGILTEATPNLKNGNIENIIIGIGLNFNTKQEDFPDELKEISGSLYNINNPNTTRNELIAKIINEVLDIYKDLNNDEILLEYKELSLVINKPIKFSRNNEWINAKALDIDSNGGLIVKTNDGKIETLNSGEISIRKL